MKIIEKIKEMPKKKLIVLISTVSSVTILITVAIIALCISASKEQEEPLPEDTGAFLEMTETTPSPSESSETEPLENTLEFHSNGNGTCSVVGIGTYTSDDVLIPAASPDGDTVIHIEASAFAGNPKIVSVTVPATVKKIDSGAFRGCSSLIAVHVSSQNSYFCSSGGVLFSKDKSNLICYPSARPGSKYLLPLSVETVSPYAFENVFSLSALLYEGSTAKYQKISITEGNSLLDKITITCNYIAEKP